MESFAEAVIPIGIPTGVGLRIAEGLAQEGNTWREGGKLHPTPRMICHHVIIISLGNMSSFVEQLASYGKERLATQRFH